jgi:hypothetical protein
VAWHIIVSHHRYRYLGAAPYGDIEATDIVHVLCVLHATEPAQRLYDIVSDLKELPCAGKKILLLGMEAVTPDVEERVKTIQELYGEAFGKILYTVHTLRDGEIVGTGSNHFEAQVAAEAYFKNFPGKQNIIFSKFDTNMRLDKDKKLLMEIEAVWCHVDPDTRRGITFMPNVYWGGDKPDRERTCMEKFVSFTMSTLLQQSSFAMAFVSGSLEGICAVGYTPPSLLAEDDLTFSKKQALLPKPSSYRLCSAILKVFDSAKNPSHGHKTRVRATKEWTCAFLDKKMKRWMMGHVEKDMYFATWLILPCCLLDFEDPHPRVRNPLRAGLLLLSSVLRMYLIFALPLNVMPFVMVNWSVEFKKADFNWLVLITILPQAQFPWGKGIGWQMPWSIGNGDRTDDDVLPRLEPGVGKEILQNGHALYLFVGYWCMVPATFICIFVMVRIQRRIYKSFPFLLFNWRTLVLYMFMFFPLMLIMGPLFLLYAFLKHGCLDMPAGHQALSRPPTRRPSAVVETETGTDTDSSSSDDAE